MRREAVCVMAMAMLVGVGVGDALAKKKGKNQKKGAPINLKLVNGCDSPLDLKFDDFKVSLKAGEKMGSSVVPPAKKHAHRLHIGSSTAEVYVQFKPGGSYAMQFANCRPGGADFSTQDLSERPKSVSPNAAAQVRFRAASRAKGPLPKFKYHTGERGRLKRLSVGFTKAVKSPAGEFAYGLVLNAPKGRGILARVKKAAKLQAGHRYLIEASAEDGEIFIKVEDEGWDKK